MNPDDSEGPQLRRLQDWWLNLPLSYRLNALLYFLGACFMVFLLTSLLSGGSPPRQIQVGAGSTPSTTGTTVRPTVTAPTSTAGASTSSPSSTGPTTSGPVGTTATTQAQANPTGGGGGGGGGRGGSGEGGGGTTTTAPAATTTTVANTVGTTPGTTTTTRPCRNSTDPACGQFTWDPAATNQPLSIGQPEISPATPQPNTEVTFRITVTDPDHVIGTCAYIDFGDLSSQGSCPDPPCPARYGAWDLPAHGGPGSFTFVFTHTYKSAAPYIATFLVDDRSDCWDPYGDRRTKPIAIVVG